MTKILFVSYGGGHINLILPILEKCRNYGFYSDILALTGAKLVTDFLKIKSFGYKDFVEDKDKKKVKYYGAKLLKENYNPESGIEEEESLYYLGINWLDNIEKFGEEKTERLYKKIKRHSFLPVNFFEKILKKNNYDLLVVTNSPKSERAAVLAANKLKIKSIRIEDLFFDDDLQNEIIMKLGSDYKSSIGSYVASPSKIFVMCNYTKDLYKFKKKALLLNSKESDIIVTGQPILDRLCSKSINYINKKKDKSSAKKCVLWAHSNGLPDNDEVLELISLWLKNFSSKSLYLAIKLHPDFSSTDKQYIDKTFSQFSQNYFFVKPNLSIDEAIKSSKVLIAQESTTMLEALFLRKPSVCLDPKNIRKDIPYLKCNICERASTSQELNELIIRSNDIDKNRFENIKKKMGFPLNASERIFSELKKLISS